MLTSTTRADTTNCTHDSDFDALTGVYQKESMEFLVKHDGDMLDATGHVHGKNSRLSIMKFSI
jgi:hypothetical protein